MNNHNTTRVLYTELWEPDCYKILLFFQYINHTKPVSLCNHHIPPVEAACQPGSLDSLWNASLTVLCSAHACMYRTATECVLTHQS